VYAAGYFSDIADFDPGTGIENHTSAGGNDAFLCKFDSGGTFQWARTWGGIGRDVVNGLVIDGEGSIYVTGPFQSTVDFNPSGGAIRSSNSGSMNNAFLSKFSPDGNFQWVQTWGPADSGGESYSVARDSSNNVFVVGDFSGTGCYFNNTWGQPPSDWHDNHPGPLASFDAFLSKFDSDGNYQWAKTWGGEGYDDGPGVAIDQFDNIYVAGMYASLTIDFDPDGGGAVYPAHDSGFVVDVFLSKFNSGGIFQWVKTWGAQGTDDAGGILAVDGENNVYVAGRYASVDCDFDPWGAPDIHSSAGSHDAFVSKFNPSGTFIWAKTWGSTGWDTATSLFVDDSNNLYVSGKFEGLVDFNPSGSSTETRSSNGLGDAFFSVFSESGAFRGVETWGGTGDDWVFHVAMSGAGDVYATGSFQNTVDFDPGPGDDSHSSTGDSDAFISKFIPATTIPSMGMFGIGILLCAFIILLRRR
jgi:hypothetical protein